MLVENQKFFERIKQELITICPQSYKTLCLEPGEYSTLEKLFDDFVINNPSSFWGYSPPFHNQFTMDRSVLEFIQDPDPVAASASPGHCSYTEKLQCQFDIQPSQLNGTSKVTPQCFRKVDIDRYSNKNGFQSLLKKHVLFDLRGNSEIPKDTIEMTGNQLRPSTWIDTASKIFEVGLSLAGMVYFTTKAYKEIRKLYMKSQDRPVNRGAQSANTQEKASRWKALAYIGGVIGSMSLANYSYRNI